MYPKSCVDHILDLYHNSIFGAHQSSQRTFLTIKQKVFIPDLMYYIRSVLKGCQICQLHKVGPTPKDNLKTGQTLTILVLVN